MRNFLITKKTYSCGKLAGFEILGMVQGDNSELHVIAILSI